MLARTVHVPIPTNPNSVVNNLKSDNVKRIIPVEEEVGIWLKRDNAADATSGCNDIRTGVGTYHERRRRTVEESTAVELHVSPILKRDTFSCNANIASECWADCCE